MNNIIPLPEDPLGVHGYLSWPMDILAHYVQPFYYCNQSYNRVLVSFTSLFKIAYIFVTGWRGMKPMSTAVNIFLEEFWPL